MKLLVNFYELFFYVVFLLTGHQSTEECDGRYGGCCDGSMFNKTLGKCVECKEGYYGQNCLFQCPFKSYGKACQMICNCSKDECNFSTGCHNDTHGEVTVQYKENMIRQSKNRPLKYALIGMFILLSTITFIYIGVCVTQWWCEKKTNQLCDSRRA